MTAVSVYVAIPIDVVKTKSLDAEYVIVPGCDDLHLGLAMDTAARFQCNGLNPASSRDSQ